MNNNIYFDSNRIEYSECYYDDRYEYRHVILPHETLEERRMVQKLARMNRYLSEGEWRAVGISMSSGWIHYGMFKPEPHVLLFRREPRE